MRSIRFLTAFYSATLIVMFILLQGCGGTTHTHVAQYEPRVTTETHTVEEQRVKHPETGAYSMEVVSAERTKTLSSRTDANVFEPPRPPDAHTEHGYPDGNTGWYFYSVCLFFSLFYVLKK